MKRPIINKDDYRKTGITMQLLAFDTLDHDSSGFSLYTFGVTDLGHSICVKIMDFLPFFYIRLNGYGVSDVILAIQRSIPKEMKECGYVKCTVANKIDADGFTGNTTVPFLRIECSHEKLFHRLRNNIGKFGIWIYGTQLTFPIYEANISPATRFCHIRNLEPTGGCKISNFNEIDSVARTQLCIETKMEFIQAHKLDRNFDFVQLSFDIEVFGELEGIPEPKHKPNVITHIGSTITTNSGKVSQVLISIEPCNKITKVDGDIVHLVCKTEKDILRKFLGLVLSVDPDIIYSFNGDIFDWPYIIERCNLHNIEPRFGRLNDKITFVPVKKNAKGESEGRKKQRVKDTTKPPEISGRINMDIYNMMRFFSPKEFSYKLNALSKKYLGETKDDISYHDIKNSYLNKDAELSKKVGLYCVQDTVLPQKLVENRQLLQNNFAMSNVCGVEMQLMIYKGETAKVFSLVIREATARGYCLPTSDFSDESFEGARVLDPVFGVYHSPVAVLDFKSLYPSIIRRWNLCYTTIVRDEKYAKMENIEYISHEITLTAKDGTQTTKTVRVAQDVPSLVPDIQANLAKCRSDAKKRMAKATDETTRNIENAVQLAYKLVGNSMYGAFGACVDTKLIAALVTKIGRDMIGMTSNFVEQQYKHLGAKTIYGDTDSVFVNLPSTTIETVFPIAQEMADNATSSLFKFPVELEFEKIYYPMVLLRTKKTYAAMKYTDPNKPPKMDKTGIGSVRGDTWKLANKLFDEVLQMCFDKTSVREIEDHIQNELFMIRAMDKSSIDDFTIRKRLGSDYSVPENQVVWQVVNKMKKRGEQDIPQVLDYVPFVYIRNGKTKCADMAEHPNFVRKTNNEINVEYYIRNLMQNRLESLLTIFMSPKSTKVLFEDAQGKKQSKLTLFFTKK